MKILALLSLSALAALSSSCRVEPPVDPMTMKQTCRCLPEHFHAYGVECGGTYYGVGNK